MVELTKRIQAAHNSLHHHVHHQQHQQSAETYKELPSAYDDRSNSSSIPKPLSVVATFFLFYTPS